MNLLTSDIEKKEKERKSEHELILWLCKLSRVFKTACDYAAQIQLISWGIMLARSTIYCFFCGRLFVTTALANVRFGMAEVT